MEENSRRFVLFLLTLSSLFQYSWQTYGNFSVINDILVDKLYQSYSENNISLTFTEFTEFYSELVGNEVNFSKGTKNVSDCLSYKEKEDIKKCVFSRLENTCPSSEDLYAIYSLPINTSLSNNDLQHISVSILYSMHQKLCLHDNHVDDNHSGPSMSAVWGYGILFVTVINLCSLVGIIVLPVMKLALYQLVLIFMVALAVGTLAGSGLLFLIPEALGLAGHDDIGYIWKSTTIIGGIYLFYLTERIMKMLMQWRQSKKKCERKEKDIYCSIKQRTPRKSESEFKDPSTLPLTAISCTPLTFLDKEPSETSIMNDIPNGKNGKLVHKSNSSLHKGDDEISTLAWMILFGDGLHNFIDGLSIGAAFTNSILSGVSVSLACICEELPHELGDFAILLNSGMSLRKALLYNFMSACMCYLGLIFGILLGESTSAHEWIFAIAGGMFLYISLVDMMPEMNSAAESEQAKKYGMIKIFILQNFGLLTGFVIMLLMAIYGQNINFE